MNLLQASRAVLIALLLYILPLSAQPPGYYDSTDGLLGEELKIALHQIIDNHSVMSYAALWTAFYTSDDRPDGTVWDIYSDVPDGTPPYVYHFGVDQEGSASGEGEGYNREHSWPRSWFGGEVLPMNTDINAIYPSDVYCNSMRGSYAYGEVSYAQWTSLNGNKRGPCGTSGYSGTVFEPRDDFKGDLARTYFYMTTRYYGEDGSWPGGPMSDGSQLLPWALEMLLTWHENDPVSQKEIDRNTAAYSLQNNRNPFIDDPQFALRMYDPEFSWDSVPLAPIEDLELQQVEEGILFSWSEPTQDVNGNPPVLIEGYTLHISGDPGFIPAETNIYVTLSGEETSYLFTIDLSYPGMALFFNVVALGYGEE